MELKYKELTHKIIGCAMEVHKELGPGFLEAIYQEALEIEFSMQNIPYKSQPKINSYYKKKRLKKFYKPDFLVFNKIVVEIKAEKKLTPIDEVQVINSLKCTKKEVALLINFGELSLKWKRYVNLNKN